MGIWPQPEPLFVGAHAHRWRSILASRIENRHEIHHRRITPCLASATIADWAQRTEEIRRMNSTKWSIITGLACLALAPVSLKAQETPPAGTEHHHAVAAHHANAMHHAKALHHHANTSKTINKEVAKEHAEEAGRSIDAAEKHTGKVEQNMSESEKKAAAPHLKSIHEHHAEAREHHAALTKELGKDQPDPAKVREHTAHIHHHVSRAHASHVELMKQRKVKEATPPTPPPDKPRQ
jgi:hypothetical protein